MRFSAQASGRASSKATPTTLPSNLFPMLFEKVLVGERLLVLDLGQATASTVEFFNQFKCRLNFVDLFSADFVVNPQDEATHG